MRAGLDHHRIPDDGGQLVRAALLVLALLALAPQAARADPAIGRLFYTPAERAALKDARRRNIRAEELAAEASKRPAAPRSRDVTLSGVVLRSDGESFAWVNGKSVEGRTVDGLRVRHTAQPNRVLVYDPDKGRMVQVKVGQRADLLTGRVEENYELRKRAPAAEPAVAPETPAREASAAGAQSGSARSSEPSKREAQPDDTDDPLRLPDTEAR
jgi:hypothetical protein